MQRVYILSQDTMFSQGIQCLLDSTKDVLILGTEANVQQAIQEIIRNHPDVVILEDEHCPTNIFVELLKICECEPRVRIINVSLKDNSVFCLYANRKPIHSVDDLVNIINGDLIVKNAPNT